MEPTEEEAVHMSQRLSTTGFALDVSGGAFPSAEAVHVKSIGRALTPEDMERIEEGFRNRDDHRIGD